MASFIFSLCFWCLCGEKRHVKNFVEKQKDKKMSSSFAPFNLSKASDGKS
jgi:hypothetical protein